VSRLLSQRVDGKMKLKVVEILALDPGDLQNENEVYRRLAMTYLGWSPVDLIGRQWNRLHRSYV
jgi:hypothetical protein